MEIAVAEPAVVEDRVTMTEPLRRFCEVFDFETYCLELSQDERFDSAIRKALEKKLDSRERAFNIVLRQHPATLRENARRAEARRIEKERLDGIAARKYRARGAEKGRGP